MVYLSESLPCTDNASLHPALLDPSTQMKSCKKSCQGFASFRNDVKLYGISKLHFIKSEWEDWKVVDRPQWPLIAWRVSYFIFCLFAGIWSMADPDRKFKHWFIFATNWTIFLQLVYSLLHTLNIILYFCIHIKRTERRSHDSNCLDATIWVLFNVVGVVPYVVTIAYWTYIYDPKHPPKLPVVTICNHGVNAVFSFIDTLVVAIPVRVTHVFYMMAFTGTYATFTFFYELGGGTYPDSPRMETRTFIYSFLNWRETPRRALISTALALIMSFVFFYVLWLLYMFRLYLVSKFAKVGPAVYERHRLGKLNIDVENEQNPDVDINSERETHVLQSEQLETVYVDHEELHLTGFKPEDL